MTQPTLTKALRSMVRRYGFEQVELSLREIGPETSKQGARSLHETTAPKARKIGRRRATAPEYVAKLKLSSEKEAVAVELARRFENKSFLPSFHDIAYFCQIYGIAIPASRSRASAIPRVFKFIAAMDLADSQKILDYGMFSGPSRLGPIADAIRRNGRADNAGAYSES